MARVGIITGSGTHALPDLVGSEPHDLDTPFGAALVTSGEWAGRAVLHVSRHGEGHARLSNHVNHRANVWALRELGAERRQQLLQQAGLVRLQSKAAQFQARARQAGWEQSLWEGLFRALGYKHNVWPMQRVAELRPHDRPNGSGGQVPLMSCFGL